MTEDKRNPHAGHRKRRRESYLASGGLTGFSDVETLELLLTYAVVRRDTNPIAHALLDTFGSLTGVFDAPLDLLQQVKGMTQRAAILLHLTAQTWKRCEQDRAAAPTILPSVEQCGEYLLPKLRNARDEQIWLLCLDGKCKLLDCRCVSVGSVNSACTPLRKILEVALTMNATSVVLAHNHTSGVAMPSAQDVQTTQRIKGLLEGVNVRLADHLVIADDDFVSMRASKLL